MMLRAVLGLVIGAAIGYGIHLATKPMGGG